MGWAELLQALESEVERQIREITGDAEARAERVLEQARLAVAEARRVAV